MAGKLYVIEGEARPGEIPEVFEPLTNRDITGAGPALVDRGTGRPSSARAWSSAE